MLILIVNTVLLSALHVTEGDTLGGNVQSQLVGRTHCLEVSQGSLSGSVQLKVLLKSCNKYEWKIQFKTYNLPPQ